VHAHTSKAGFLARFAALLAGVRVRIYSPRGTILEGYFTGPRRWFFTRLERLSARWTHAIIGLTSEESESYLAAGIGRPEQHLHIPVGIDSDAYSPPDETTRLRTRREESVGDDEVLIISTGRLVPVKDHATLIRGLNLLKDLDTPWRCWIIGSGPEEKRLQSMIQELSLEKQVRLWGYKRNVNQLLGLGDIFALTSVNEGFGRALLEAMAARLAVVATEVGGVPTVLDKGKVGFLVPPADPEALAEVLRQLIRSPDERLKWAQLGYERVRAVFNLETTVVQHIELYERLLCK
ncbi:MAG: glycosyltransferase, partial [Candidatus Krumholzibacteria bacterium]|nr:glycosyltransferase [Candidatus Krumholzibacteria bacterium]